MKIGRKENTNLKTRTGKSRPIRNLEYLLKIMATTVETTSPRSISARAKLPAKPSQMIKEITSREMNCRAITPPLYVKFVKYSTY
jgi:hypothetical protein